MRSRRATLAVTSTVLAGVVTMKQVVWFATVFLALTVTEVVASSQLEHPNFSASTKFLICEGVKFAGKPKPRVYFYAIDGASMTVYRLDSDEMRWSAPFSMVKTPAQIIVEQRYGAWRIDRETLTTSHQSSVSSACSLVSLEQIDGYASELESKAKI